MGLGAEEEENGEGGGTQESQQPQEGLHRGARTCADSLFSFLSAVGPPSSFPATLVRWWGGLLGGGVLHEDEEAGAQRRGQTDDTPHDDRCRGFDNNLDIIVRGWAGGGGAGGG